MAEKEKAPAVVSGQEPKQEGSDIIPSPPKEANYVRFPLACLHSEFPLEEIPPDYARRIFQRCLAWHIVATKADPALFGDMVDDVSQIEALASEVATTFGKQCGLLPNALFRSAMNEWEYRKFSILAALYAAIGTYDYRIVTREKILAGSVGFSNARERQANGSTFEPISVSKLRSMLDHLVSVSLIVRSRYNGRTTAYGRVKPQANLGDKIKARRDKIAKKKDADFWTNFEKSLRDSPLDTTRPARSEPQTPRETSDQRDERLRNESLEREARAEAHRLSLYPPRPKPPAEPPATSSAVTPKVKADPPTPEEIELRRQQLLRLVGEK
jgi:hypothetical protein